VVGSETVGLFICFPFFLFPVLHLVLFYDSVRGRRQLGDRIYEIEQIVALFLGDGIAPNPIYQET
jgi:hypothetical protein